MSQRSFNKLAIYKNWPPLMILQLTCRHQYLNKMVNIKKESLYTNITQYKNARRKKKALKI